MIKFEETEVVGFDHAIRGMRNPMNSWDKMDSKWIHEYEPGTETFIIGENDMHRMTALAKGGPVHAKYRRMISVYVDITAPLYWWKEFDTYKVGTVSNSCSTMRRIHDKEFTIADFSHEHLFDSANKEDTDCWIEVSEDSYKIYEPINILETIVEMLNKARILYLEYSEKATNGNVFAREHVKEYWWQMIQLLPSSYNQKRTIMLNYEVLTNIYESRKSHKLDEWHIFCAWIESLPYSNIITEKREDRIRWNYISEVGLPSREND